MYAKKPSEVNLESCTFYHTMDLPGLGVVSGTWDLRENIDNYFSNFDFKGKRVLDVGTASGFLTFEIEKKGGEVVSFDADDASRISFVPFQGHLYTKDRTTWRAETNAYLQKWRNSYWFAHDKLESNARVFYGDVYQLPTSLGQFDVIMLGQILVHLRDPILALESVCNLCSDTLIIAEGMVDSKDRISSFLPRAAQDGPEYAWWHLSTGLYKEILDIMGFEVVKISKDRFKCNADNYPSKIEITTIVAERTTRRTG